MIVLGIDSAMEGHAGFAVMDTATHTILHTQVETYALDRSKNLVKPTKRIPEDNDWDRAVRFAIVVQELYVKWKPDVIVTEMIRTWHQGKRNPVVVASLSIPYTAILLVTKKPTVIVVINVGTWQAHILPKGYRADTKAASIARVEQCYKVTLPEHVCDAVNMIDAYPFVLADPEVNTEPNCVRVMR